MIFQMFHLLLNFVYVRWHFSNICDVTTIKLSNGTVHIFFFFFFLLFMKMYLPSSFILRYVRAEMNEHAFMNELDQKDY